MAFYRPVIGGRRTPANRPHQYGVSKLETVTLAALPLEAWINESLPK